MPAKVKSKGSGSLQLGERVRRRLALNPIPWSDNLGLARQFTDRHGHVLIAVDAFECLWILRNRVDHYELCCWHNASSFLTLVLNDPAGILYSMVVSKSCRNVTSLARCSFPIAFTTYDSSRLLLFHRVLRRVALASNDHVPHVLTFLVTHS